MLSWMSPFLRLICLVVLIASQGHSHVHWGNSSRKEELLCGWPLEDSSACRKARKLAHVVRLRAGEVYGVDDFLNAEEAAWLSTAFDDEKYVTESGSLNASYKRVEPVPPDLRGSLEELVRRIHGHAILHIHSSSEIREVGWAFNGMFYPDDVTFRRYQRSQSTVQPHQDTGTFGRCLSATLHIGPRSGDGGELQTFRCRAGQCSIVGWQYDEKKHPAPMDDLLKPSNLELQASLQYKPGRITFFLAETVHAVAAATDYDREILFIWFSCAPTVTSGAIKSGHLPLIQHLVKQGADVRSVIPNTRVTPAYFASISGHAPILSYLHKQGASLDTVDVLGQTLLHTACQHGHLTVTKFLTKGRADFSAVDTNAGMTPLVLAAKHGHVPILGHLLGDNVAALEPLVFFAAVHGHCNMLRYLSRWTAADMCKLMDNGMAAPAVMKCSSTLGDNGLDVGSCKRSQVEPPQMDAHALDPPQVASHASNARKVDDSFSEAAQEIDRVCPEELIIPRSGKVSGFPLNVTHLKLRRGVLKIRVCERRTKSIGGILAIDGLLDVVGGAGGVNAGTLGVVDEEIVRLLGRDVVAAPLMPRGIKALRVLNPAKEAANVHHDRNIASPKYATTMIYLNDEVDGLQGGHTIFPTLARQGQQLDESQQKLSEYFHKTYDKALQDYERSRDLIDRPGTDSLQMVNDMCSNIRTPNKPKAHYFAIKPRLGWALIWWSFVGKKGGPYVAELGEHWHAGCGHNIQKLMLVRFAYIRPDLMPGDGEYEELIPGGDVTR